MVRSCISYGTALGKTGKLIWYFQYTPGDYFDFDETGVHLLIDREINGKNRKVVVHFGRNGFFYRLDRTNGSFIGAKQYVDKLNWTEGIDPKTGKPLGYDPSSGVQEYVKGIVPRRGGPDRVTSCPHVQGGINYWPTAYNPDLKLAYGASIEGCMDIVLSGSGDGDIFNAFLDFQGEGHPFLGGGVAVKGAQKGSLLAYAKRPFLKRPLQEPPQLLSPTTPTPHFSPAFFCAQAQYLGAVALKTLLFYRSDLIT